MFGSVSDSEWMDDSELEVITSMMMESESCSFGGSVGPPKSMSKGATKPP